MKKLILVFTLLVTYGKSTISEYGEFYIPYQRVQSEYVCLQKQIMMAEYGIPLASLLQGILSETRTVHQSFNNPDNPISYRNINLLAMNNVHIIDRLKFDRYTTSRIYDYSFVLDLSQLNRYNGDSQSGRAKTINSAKLAVVSIVKTAESIFGAGHFRIWIEFKNLPSQKGLAGSRLISHSHGDWPNWPYTANSPVYHKYLDETVHPSCRE